MSFAVPLPPFAPSSKAPMSAARLAAEAAFAYPEVALERRPAVAVVIEVKPRRNVTGPAADDQHTQANDVALPHGDRAPRVFRMEPALRQAMGLPAADDGSAPTPEAATAAPMTLRRKRKLVAPVHVVQAAPVAPFAPPPMPEPTSGRWAEIAQALARLESTVSAIRAAQAFNSFAAAHLPPATKSP